MGSMKVPQLVVRDPDIDYLASSDSAIMAFGQIFDQIA